MAELHLDICTPQGKTWLARITGSGGKCGLEREFVNAVSRDTSKSGKTGTAYYVIDDGVYESNEGRTRYGRRYWKVSGDDVTEIDRSEALAAL